MSALIVQSTALTRDGARAAFAASGHTYDVLSLGSLEVLRRRIDGEMKRAGLMHGKLRMSKVCRLDTTPNGTHAQLRCKAHYFEDREAVTFGADGFIGFAGWADDINIQPILTAFISWVATLASQRDTTITRPNCGGVAQ